MPSDTSTYFLSQQLAVEAKPIEGKGENPNKTPAFMYDLGQKNPSSFINKTVQANPPPVLSRWLTKNSDLSGMTCRMLCVNVIQDKPTAGNQNICPLDPLGDKGSKSICCYNGNDGLTSQACPKGTVQDLRTAIDSAQRGLTGSLFFYPNGELVFYGGDDGATLIRIPTSVPLTLTTEARDQVAADVGNMILTNQLSMDQCEGSFIIPDPTLGYLLFDEGRALGEKGSSGRILILYNPMHRNIMIEYLTYLIKQKNGANEVAKLLSCYAAAVVTSSNSNTISGNPYIFGDPMGNILWQINTMGSNLGKAEMRPNHEYLVGNAVTGQNSALWDKLDLTSLISKLSDGGAYCLAPAAQWTLASSEVLTPTWVPGIDFEDHYMPDGNAAAGAPQNWKFHDQVAPTAIFWWLWNNMPGRKFTSCKPGDITRLCNILNANKGPIPASSLNQSCIGRDPGGDKPGKKVALILGIILGVLVVLGLIGGGVWYYMKKHKK